jgi:hypothetical protein
LSIVQGPVSVAPCQTVANTTIRNVFIGVQVVYGGDAAGLVHVWDVRAAGGNRGVGQLAQRRCSAAASLSIKSLLLQALPQLAARGDVQARERGGKREGKRESMGQLAQRRCSAAASLSIKSLLLQALPQLAARGDVQARERGLTHTYPPRGRLRGQGEAGV